MKYASITLFDKDTKISGVENEEAYAAGSVPKLAPFTDEAPKLEFEDLKASMTAADSAAATSDSINDITKRIALVQAAAMYRDAQYSTAGRKFLLGLSLHNSCRVYYEVAKSYIDVNGSEA